MLKEKEQSVSCLEGTKGREVEDEVRGLVSGSVITEAWWTFFKDRFRLSEMRSNWRDQAEE